MKYQYPECERCVGVVGPVNFWGNLSLMVFKLVFGLMCGSVALVADAIHSLGDIVVSVVLMFSLAYSAKKADKDHHFGHGKIEFIGASIIGVGMVLVATLIILFSITAAMAGGLEMPDRVAILVALVSIGGNYLMYKHSLCAGQQANSAVMIANAYENRADVLSSAAALIGIIGAQMGYLYLDPLAAVVIGALILHSAIKIIIEGARGLADYGVRPEVVADISAAVTDIDGVMGIHSLRTRWVGQEFEVGVRVKVDSDSTVEWSRDVVAKIRDAVRSIMGRNGTVKVGFEGVGHEL